uniref:Putative structural protein n=1 Tax=Picornavirales N_OV_001 TaxID=2016023 RepID=A0A218NJT9_9VIRU|nr:putative structural protein [Picornavirales N_OV_001]
MLRSALSRMVQIDNRSVSLGDATGFQINPYNLIVSNSFIGDKIANYMGLRSGLKIQIRVNATPFHFGSILVSYVPFHDIRRSTSLAPDQGLARLCQLSSTTHHAVLPLSGSSSVELDIPYIYFKDFINLRGEFTGTGARDSSATTLSNVGTLFFTFISPLRNASTSTSDVTLSTFASLIDPHVSLPTTQSGEFAEKPVSTIASAVVKGAGYASRFRALRPFAKATSDVFTAVGSVANLFGWSRVDSVADPMPMRPEFFGNLSVVDRKELSQPLALDSKCELAVSPDTVRLSLGDELTFDSLCSRDAIIHTSSVSVPSVPRSFDLWVPVSPFVQVVSVGGGNPVTMPPCAIPAQFFRYWRGNMRYKLRMVKSQVHTGRLQIRHDALVASSGTASDITQVKTTLWNLGDSDEIEICVPWVRDRQFLPMHHSTSVKNHVVSVAPIAQNELNGFLHITNITDIICSSNSTSPLTIVISVSMDSPEFAGPRDVSDFSAMPATQSGEEPCEQDMSGCLQPTDNLIYMGEKIHSMRALMKRYYYYSFGQRPDSGRVLWQNYYPDFPLLPGETPTGRNTTSVGSADFVRYTPTSFLTQCFALYRGSQKYKVAFSTTGAGNEPPLVEVARSNIGIVSNQTTTGLSFDDSNSFEHQMLNNAASGGAGMCAMVDGFRQCEVTLPFYSSNYACVANKENQRTYYPDDSRWHTHVVSIATGGSSSEMNYRIYHAAGTDFAPYYFCYVPLLTNLSTLDLP